MLHLTFSNRVESFVALLDEHIGEARRRGAGLYQRIDVVSPSGPLNGYIELALASRAGVCANINITFLNSFLRGLLGPRLASEGVKLLERTHVQTLIRERLSDTNWLAHDDFEALRAYIETANDEDGRDVRRFQLSARLATLFEEYEYSRAEMLEAWSREASFFDEAKRSEGWQRRLWRGVEQDARALNLMSMTACFAREPVQLDAPLHIFGFAHLSPAVTKIIARLAGTNEVYLWMLQPAAVILDNRVLRYQADVHPAHRQWGKLSVDTLGVLNAYAAELLTPPVNLFDAPTATAALLTSVQSELSAKPMASVPSGDRSIEFLACSGIQREVEVVANAIWQRVVAAEGKLHFHDFGVVVAGRDAQEYVAQIESVFQDFHDLPYNITGIASDSSGRIIDALRMLVALPFGRFHRGEMMGLLTHPNIGGHLAVGELESWVEWCDKLNIISGAERPSAKTSYLSKDLHNWSQGIKRLTLGSFLSSERSGLREIFEIEDDSYIVEEISSADMVHAARMSVLARSLIRDAQWLLTERFTLTQWAEVFEALVATYLAPAADNDDDVSADRKQIGRCKHIIAQIAGQDLSGQRVSYRTASLTLLAALDGVDTRARRPLTHGIAVGTAQALRALPFAFVYMLGMGEGEFPATNPTNPLDLRQDGSPLTGDVYPNARDRQAFLDLLLCSRQALTMSWVARDAATGANREPSSLVKELQALLAGHVPATRHMALRRYEIADTSGNYHPEALIEARMQAIGDSLRAFVRDKNTDMPSAATLRRHLQQRDEKLGGLLRLPVPPTSLATLAQAAATEPRRVSVTIAQLRSFLESPLQGAASFKLKMQRDEDDPLAVEHERFAPGPMDNTVFLRKVFAKALEQPLDRVDDSRLAALYDELLLPWHELGGALPTGIFLDATRAEHLKVLKTWHKNARWWADQKMWKTSEKIVTTRLACVDVEGERTLPPLEIAIVLTSRDGVDEQVIVEISGKCDLVFESSIMLCVTKAFASPKYLLRAWLSHLVLAACDVLETGERGGYLILNINSCWTPRRTEYQSNNSRKLTPLSSADARQSLGVILTDFLGKAHGYLLPIELVSDYLDSPNQESFDAPNWISDELDKDWQSLSDRFGPIKNYFDYFAPADWQKMIEQRFEHHPDFVAEPMP
ncbi:MAG: exodeoxyribonuclease V subunit gamma [Bradymonadaceae bacterium]|nr:exodeoxyribonuclease V subunit gamma [Lujinxingiaceae bacterium]